MPARADSMADGLEALALSGPTRHVRSMAAGLLGLSHSSLDPAVWAATVARLGRIYRRTDDAVVRGMVIRQLGSQRGEPEAVRLLIEILESEPLSSGCDVEPEQAAYALSWLGPEGQAAMVESLRAGRIRYGRAGLLVQSMIQREFRP